MDVPQDGNVAPIRRSRLRHLQDVDDSIVWQRQWSEALVSRSGTDSAALSRCLLSILMYRMVRLRRELREAAGLGLAATTEGGMEHSILIMPNILFVGCALATL